MAKSIIVYGRDLKQMQKYAERITKHLGMKRFELWGVGRPSLKFTGNDTVVFFEWALCEVPQIKNGHKAISFAEVAEHINAAISLTGWEKGDPPRIGEWSVIGSLADKYPVRRWWNGRCWSYHWIELDKQFTKNIAASKNQAPDWRPFWRGLSEEPILVKP